MTRLDGISGHSTPTRPPARIRGWRTFHRDAILDEATLFEAGDFRIDMVREGRASTFHDSGS